MNEIFCHKPAHTVAELASARQHQENARPSWSARWRARKKYWHHLEIRVIKLAPFSFFPIHYAPHYLYTDRSNAKASGPLIALSITTVLLARRSCYEVNGNKRPIPETSHCQAGYFFVPLFATGSDLTLRPPESTFYAWRSRLESWRFVDRRTCETAERAFGIPSSRA